MPKCLLAIIFAAAPAPPQAARAELAVHDGARLAFLGDSITRYGMEPVGYVSLVIDGLKTAGVTAEAIGAGIAGNTSRDMLARLPLLLQRRKPTWLLLNCGVNDVYLRDRGVPLDAFRVNVTRIVAQAQAQGVPVMLLTPTMMGEDPNSPSNRTLAGYVNAVREIATAKKCLLADVHADMERELDALAQAGQPRGNLLTASGAHLNAHGNVVVAAGVLRAFGMDEATLARAKEAWLDIPGAATVGVSLTLRQLDALEKRAATAHTTVKKLLRPSLDAAVVDFLAR